MKKSLLILSLMMLAAVSAWAVTDGQTYNEVNGLKMQNLWIFDRVHTRTAYNENPVANQRARTATMLGGVVYVGRSEAQQAVTAAGDTVNQSVLYRFSAADGTYLGPLPLTLNGDPYGVFLGIASVGRDDFGHLWVAPMTSNLASEIPIYVVNTTDGSMTLVTRLEKGDAVQRTDYLDVVGDLTRKSAECNIMTVANSTESSGFPTVYRWHADQGGDFEGGWDGDTYLTIEQFYPETKVGFSLAPVVKMIYGPDDETRYSGNMFYIDSYDGAPVLYDNFGTMIDNFEKVDPALLPQYAPNGMIEFNIDGKEMLTYVIADMNGNGHGCQANICQLGEGGSLEGMTKYWTIPADSMGKLNDSGLRVHCFAAELDTINGQQVVDLFTFKAYNGMAVYRIGKDLGGDTPAVKGDLNGDGVVNTTDVTELVNAILAGKTDAAYDIDGDGGINTSDVTALVSLVLSK